MVQSLGPEDRGDDREKRAPGPALAVLLLSYAGFIALGLPDTVLGVAWPSLRASFGLSQSALGSVLMAGLCGYFLSGLASGSLLARLGPGGLLGASSALVAGGLIAYAVAPSWSWFFPVGAVLGLGSGAIDAGLNSYAARHFSVRHVNWLHACWGVGATIGPLVMTSAIARGFGYSSGYVLLAAALGSVALAFLLTRRMWRESERGDTSSVPPISSRATGNFRGTLRSSRVWLAVATFFVYTGLEATLGQWSFTLMREGRGLGVEAAGSWTAAYWGSLMLGRFALGFVVERTGPDRLLRLASAGVLTGVIAFALSSGLPGRLGLLLSGLSLAPIFPTLMARTPARLGSALAEHAFGLQVSAGALAAALLPGVVGLIIAQAGLGAIGVSVIILSAGFLLLHEAMLRMSRTSSRPPASAHSGSSL
jgi:fucose permease